MRGSQELRIVVCGMGAVLLLSGCFSRSSSPMVSTGDVSTVVIHQPINELEREPVPGTVNDVWAEPMIDTVQVPAQLDPHGIYYRPTHKTLAEIRPGRYQKVQFPDEYGVDGRVSTAGADRLVTPQGIEQK